MSALIVYPKARTKLHFFTLNKCKISNIIYYFILQMGFQIFWQQMVLNDVNFFLLHLLKTCYIFEV